MHVLPQSIHPEVRSGPASPDTHQSETIPLRYMLKNILPVRSPQTAHENAHKRLTVPMWDMPEALQAEFAPKLPP